MANLTAIPSVPNGTDKSLAGFLTAVRSRLNQLTGNQFTDAEAARLRALLSSSPQSSGSVAAASYAPVFLDAPVKFYSGQGKDWTTYYATEAGVPAGASAVMISGNWLWRGKHYAEFWVMLRIDDTKGNSAAPWDDTFLICHGGQGNDDSSDIVGANNAGIYPLRADGSFDYRHIETAEVNLYIYGYIPGASS